jgi:hypothetical protein
MSLVGSCSPTPCDCCVGTAYIQPGEQSQVVIDFSYWLGANAGFSLAAQFPPTLTFRKYTTEGLVTMPVGEVVTVPDYVATPASATQIKGNELRVILLVDQDVVFNSVYRIDVLVTARDCDARIITKKECILIHASEC